MNKDKISITYDLKGKKINLNFDNRKEKKEWEQLIISTFKSEKDVVNG